MDIRQLCRFDVSTIDPEAMLVEASLRMETMEVSSFPVVRAGELVGIITERDVVRAVAEGDDVRMTNVGAYMTPDPFTARVDEDSTIVARRMMDRGVRHLPVTDDGRFVGIISARDLLVLEAQERSSGAGVRRSSHRPLQDVGVGGY
jgi:CBS domain-containing protein